MNNKILNLTFIFLLSSSILAMEETQHELASLKSLPTELIFNILVSINDFPETITSIKNLAKTNRNFRQLLYSDSEFAKILINHLAKKFKKNFVFVAVSLSTEGSIDWLLSKTNNSLEELIDLIAKELHISKLHGAALLGTKNACMWIHNQLRDKQINKEAEYLLLDLASKDDSFSIFAIKSLLESGINLNAKDNRPVKLDLWQQNVTSTLKTPLIIAAECGNIKAVRLLIKYINKLRFITRNPKKININYKSSGSSALEYAIKNGHLDIVKILFFFAKRTFGLLSEAISANKNRESITNFLINQNVDINKRSHYYHETALMNAARTFDTNLVLILINNGAKINSRDKYGATALIYAIKAGCYEIVRLLLLKDAEVNLTDTFYNNYTPLMIAIDKRYPDIALLLIAANANIHKEIEVPIFGKTNAATIAMKKYHSEDDSSKIEKWEELLEIFRNNNAQIFE